MARFFPGQQVKKVRGRLPGALARFVEYTDERPSPTCAARTINCIMVIQDEWKTKKGKACAAGSRATTHTQYWEPVVPSGAEPGTWEECLWQPSGIPA